MHFTGAMGTVGAYHYTTKVEWEEIKVCLVDHHRRVGVRIGIGPV